MGSLMTLDLPGLGAEALAALPDELKGCCFHVSQVHFKIKVRVPPSTSTLRRMRLLPNG